MTAFNFKGRFVEAVRSGRKCQTIRREREDGRDPKPGDELQLFTGMRSPRCKRIFDTRCRDRQRVVIDELEGTVEILLDGKKLNEGQREIFAIADGFDSWDELEDFILEQYELPFRGYVYYWPKPGSGQ